VYGYAESGEWLKNATVFVFLWQQDTESIWNIAALAPWRSLMQQGGLPLRRLAAMQWLILLVFSAFLQVIIRKGNVG
jgi:hypothetical protein